MQAEAASQQTIEDRGRATPLVVAQNGYPCLESRAVFDAVGNLTGMTSDERELFLSWADQAAAEAR